MCIDNNYVTDCKNLLIICINLLLLPHCIPFLCVLFLDDITFNLLNMK